MKVSRLGLYNVEVTASVRRSAPYTNVGSPCSYGQYLDISANDFKFNDRNDMGKALTRDNLHDVKENDQVYSLHSPNIKFSSYTIPKVNKFVIRPFIGITYNLSDKNVLKAVLGEGVKTFRDNLNSTP